MESAEEYWESLRKIFREGEADGSIHSNPLPEKKTDNQQDEAEPENDHHPKKS